MNRRRISSVLKGFLRLSETFIADEVKLLIDPDRYTDRFAIKAGDALSVRRSLHSAPLAKRSESAGRSRVNSVFGASARHRNQKGLFNDAVACIL